MSNVTMVEAAILWAEKHMPEAEGFNSGACSCSFDDPAPCGGFTAYCELAKKKDCKYCDALDDGECTFDYGFCMTSLEVGEQAMTELELYKFITDNDIITEWCGGELIAWLDYYDIFEFVKLVKIDSTNSVEEFLQSYQIAIDLATVCHVNNINPENIKEKADD